MPRYSPRTGVVHAAASPDRPVGAAGRPLSEPQAPFRQGRRGSGWGAGFLALVGLTGLLAAVLPCSARQDAARDPGLGRRAAIEAAGRRLVAAYPDHLAGIDGETLVWRDGTRMPLDDGAGPKSFADWLSRPDIEDMLRLAYPAGSPPVPPPADEDPGRARNAAFFDKMYGDCRSGGARHRLVEIVWLPRKAGQRLEVTTVNGVDKRLEAISHDLDALPETFDRYLVPSAGTFNCRPIAGTDRASAHGYGIAIDIATRHADYWRWSSPDAAGRPAFRNRVPMEIVAIFEAHGFIWGGRWHHFDTMHFEYRPELAPPRRP